MMLKVPALIAFSLLLSLVKQDAVQFSDSSRNGAITTIDGPYILFKGDSLVVNYIDSVDQQRVLRSSQFPQADMDKMELVVNTDEPGKTFTVKLKSSHTPEKSIYNKVKKMLVMSDIEGEFGAMRKLLQSNGVIDKDYNWTFGDGHLVLVGDFVDRGTMVTEVLWLIYSLEAKAEAAGGKVHYILGNHEVMNMNGDHNYVDRRYFIHAEDMGVPYQKLFSTQSELGRWMLSKNVTERINNILFSHGGYSAYMNIAKMELKQINDTSRVYYSDTTMHFKSIYSELIFSDDGPFWYRGYYYGKPKASKAQVDSTLDIYSSRHIVTGHTIVAKEIMSFYDGKVINLDVPHHKGYSEALLVEEKKMYRVNEKGEKMDITAVY